MCLLLANEGFPAETFYMSYATVFQKAHLHCMFSLLFYFVLNTGAYEAKIYLKCRTLRRLKDSTSM